MKAHRHRAIPGACKTRAWMYCVTPYECAANPARQSAHGNIVWLDVCRCGASRMTEVNSGRRNIGAWTEKENETK